MTFRSILFGAIAATAFGAGMMANAHATSGFSFCPCDREYQKCLSYGNPVQYCDFMYEQCVSQGGCTIP